MRRFFMMLSVIGTLAAASAAPGFAQSGAICPNDPDHPNGVMRAASVYEDVTYWRRGEMAGFEPLRNGTVLCRSDVILTLGDGRARLEFLGSQETEGPNIVYVGPGTHARVGPLLDRRNAHSNPDAGVVEVFKGTIRAIIKRINRDAAFSVRTGSAVCGSRGTDYYVETDPLFQETVTTVVSGLVACNRPSLPGEELIAANQRVRVTEEGLGVVEAVSDAYLEELAGYVGIRLLDDAAPAGPGPDAAAITGLPLPGAGNLPAGCKAPVMAEGEVPRSRYKYCDPGASAEFIGCAITLCVTGDQRTALADQRPELVFETLPDACAPACDVDAGLKRLEFYRHGKFCGSCPDGTAWHRGLGCCR